MTTPVNESPARGLRRPLKWGLGIALAAAAAALLLPSSAVVEVRSDRTAAKGPAAQPGPDGRIDRSAAAVTPSPRFAESAAASAGAVFDPFAGAPVAAPAAPPQAVPLVAPAPPAPTPPAQDYRFLGRMTGPDGSQQILLGSGEKAVSIATGTVLDNGYVVESISTETVVLVFPALGVRHSIAIPVN